MKKLLLVIIAAFSCVQAKAAISQDTVKLYIHKQVHDPFVDDNSSINFFGKEYSLDSDCHAKLPPFSQYIQHINIIEDELIHLEQQGLIGIENIKTSNITIGTIDISNSSNLPEAYYKNEKGAYFVRIIEQKIPKLINVFFKDSFIKNPFVLEAIRSYGIDTTELTYAFFDDGYLGSMLLNSFSFALSIDYKKIKTLEKQGAFKVYRALCPIKNMQDNVVAVFWNPEYNGYLGQSKICFVTLA